MAGMAEKATVVIPTFNAGDKLVNCLRTLRQAHNGVLNAEVIVVNDGGPNPRSAREACDAYGATLIAYEDNRGFARAVNEGIKARAVDSWCVILVNDDLSFQMPAVTHLVRFLKSHPQAGVVGACLLFADGFIQHAGVSKGLAHEGKGLTPAQFPLAFKNRQVFAVTGALFAVSGALVRKTGGLDDKYGMAYEDVDFCMQAKEMGKEVWYCGQAWALHEEGGTRGKTWAEMKTKNEKWFERELRGRKRLIDKWGAKIGIT